MAKFKKFGEFLTKKSNKDTIDAKDGLAGEDYDGPLSTKPPQAPTKGKNDKPLPYKASGEIEKGVVYTANDPDEKKGLATHATPGITPQTSSLGQTVSNKTKQSPKQKRMTSEQFVNTTKDMSDFEFVRYLSEANSNTDLSTVTDLFGNQFTPDPTQTFEYVASLLSNNPNYVSKFVRELKRRDGLDNLMEELFSHQDTYHHIIDHLEDPETGDENCARLGRFMNDRHMDLLNNFVFGDEEEEDSPFGESVDVGIKQLLGDKPGSGSMNKAVGGATGGGSGPDGTPNPNYAPQGEKPGGSFGGGGPFGGDNSKGGPMGGQGPQFPGQPPLMPPKKMKEGGDVKFKGRSAATSIINELSGYPHFKKHMIDRCSSGDC